MIWTITASQAGVATEMIFSYKKVSDFEKALIRFYCSFDKLMITLPFVAYGIFRCLYLVYNKSMGEISEGLFLRDWHLFST
jgi:hypothetical protein